MLASKACDVHTLLVAFSLRMCCSRVCGMRASKAQGHAESLGVAERDVGSPFSRGLKHRKSQEIGGAAQQRALLVNGVGQGLEVVDTTVRIGILHHDAHQVIAELLDLRKPVRARDVRDRQDADAKALSTPIKHLNGLGVELVRHDKGLAWSLRPGRG